MPIRATAPFDPRAAVRGGTMLLTVVLLCLALVAPAFAHASLLHSEPADDSLLDAPPKTLALTFNEVVSPIVVRLVGPDDKGRIVEDVKVVDNTLVADLPPDIARGTSVLSWRVTSADGHPVGGAVVFSVGERTGVQPAAEQPASDPVVDGLLWAARLIIAVGVTMGIAGVAFERLVARTETTPAWAYRAIATALTAGLVADMAFVGLQGLDVLGLSIGAVAQPAVWSAGLFGTSYGLSAVLWAMGFLLAGAARECRPRAAASTAAILALVLAGVSFAASGHAATAEPQWLMRPAVFIHVVMVSLWLGSLLPLAGLLASRNEAAKPALRRFTATIPFGVALLLGTGILLAIVQVGTPEALWTTTYGRILLTKLALVVLLLLLAAANRFRFTIPALSQFGGHHPLVNSISVMLVLAGLALGVVGLWRFTPPPRSLATIAVAQVAPQTIHIEKNGVAADVTLAPPTTGLTTVKVSGLTHNGAAIAPGSVAIELEKPSYGLGPFDKTANRTADGSYAAPGFYLPIDGFWIVHVDVLVSDFDSAELTDVFTVTK